jgi:hypothetical protein
MRNIEDMSTGGRKIASFDLKQIYLATVSYSNKEGKKLKRRKRHISLSHAPRGLSLAGNHGNNWYFC